MSASPIAIPHGWICAKCGKARAEHTTEGNCDFERLEYDFVGMTRIKNEERWLTRVLDSILPLCSRVFLLDDHSSDGSREIYESYPEVLAWQSPFAGINEARDKNWLYDRLSEQCRAEWILCVDGDEVLEKSGPQTICDHCNEHGIDCDAFSLQIIFLWNDERTARVDRTYGDFWRPSLFRPFHPDPDDHHSLALLPHFRFMSTPFGHNADGNKPNLHCSSIPQRLLHNHRRCPTRLKHYGYMDRADRVRKLDFYTSIDWLDVAEDCYRHMIQGDSVDISELPKTRELIGKGRLSINDVRNMLDVAADKYLVHAGPLQLAEFKE